MTTDLGKRPGQPPAFPQAARQANPRPAPGHPARVHPDGRRGRGALSNLSGRFEKLAYAEIDDGWNNLEDAPPRKTHVTAETAKRILTRNASPDIPFDRSLNPYRGCEHGCIYCFARPTHAYMGLSPGLDFESRLFAKPNAAQLLKKELSRPGYECRTLAIGTNTDPYQPIERDYRLMRQVLEVLDRFNHPVSIVTKSALVTRDIDILSSMAKRGLVKVMLSITTLDAKLARAMEPRASTPSKRMEALEMLSAAGIPTGVMVAPVIPSLTDHEMEKILRGAAFAGVQSAGYILLRLPLEISDLFKEWLEENAPDRAKHVLTLLRDMRGGKDYDAEWGKRMRGEGPYAWMLKRRFEIASEKLGLVKRSFELDCSQFRAPPRKGEQLALL